MTKVWRVLIASLLAACLAVMLLIAFWPGHIAAEFDARLLAWIDSVQDAGAPSWFDYAFVERTANVLLFIPLGALLALVFPRRLWWIAPVAAAMLSVTIELVQALMPNRVASVIDIIANALGGLIGAIVVVLVRRYGRPSPR